MRLFLTLAALALWTAAPPAAAEGGRPPQSHLHGHGHMQPDCRPRLSTTRTRNSDDTMLDGRYATLPECPRRRGPLHHLFHGRRH